MTGPISQPAAQSADSIVNGLLRHPALRPRLWRRLLQHARVQRAHGATVRRHGGHPQIQAPTTDSQPLHWPDSRSPEPSHYAGSPGGAQVCGRSRLALRLVTCAPFPVRAGTQGSMKLDQAVRLFTVLHWPLSYTRSCDVWLQMPSKAHSVTPLHRRTRGSRRRRRGRVTWQATSRPSAARCFPPSE